MNINQTDTIIKKATRSSLLGSVQYSKPLLFGIWIICLDLVVQRGELYHRLHNIMISDQ